jgi:hypothetical protein
MTNRIQIVVWGAGGKPIILQTTISRMPPHMGPAKNFI